MNEILLSLNPYGIFWKNPCGVGKCLTTGSIVKYGLPGSPDIIGFLRNGKFCGIECKTGGAQLSKLQRSFRSVALNHRTVYIEARDVNSCLHEIKLIDEKIL